MKLVRRCTVLAFASFILAATVQADEPKTPFALSVVPSRSSTSARRISTAEKQPEVFYVVLTNVSDRPQPVYETWNSWGSQTLSFEVDLPDGKHLSITRKERDYTKNSPSVFVIPPGEQQVYAVRLDAEWDHRPVFAAAGETPITLKAVYSVAPSAEPNQQGVWTGRIKSGSYGLSLEHW